MHESTGTCIAYLANGNICAGPATILDPQRGGMVCAVHARRAAEQVFPGLASLAAAEKDCGCKGDCVSQHQDRATVTHTRVGDVWAEITCDRPDVETRVYDDEWEQLWTLPGACSADLVRTVLALCERQWERGKAAGRRDLQADLLELLGAKPRRDEE